MVTFHRNFELQKFNVNNPFFQSVFLLIIYLISAIAVMLLQYDIIWKLALTVNLLYIAMNSILGLQIRQYRNYIIASLLNFVLFNLILVKLSAVLSGIPFMQTQSIRPIFLTLWVCYPIFITIIFLVRFVVQMANEEM